MNPLVNQKPGYSMAWAPAPIKRLPPPSQPSKYLGQATGGQAPFLLFGDTLVAGSAALLAWGLHQKDNSWSTFWWVVAGIAFVKGLHDASNL